MTERMTTDQFRRVTGTEALKKGPTVKAKGRKKRLPGEMNGVEQHMHSDLAAAKHRGEIADFAYESHKLRLADKTWFTPDFWILHNDGAVEFRECKAAWKTKKGGRKAHWEEDARVKMKVAAEQYPWYVFTAYAEVPKGEWLVETFND